MLYNEQLDISQVSKMLKIDEDSILEYIKNGKIKSNGKFINIYDLGEFIRNNSFFYEKSRKSKNTKNCYLIYDGKKDECEIYNKLDKLKNKSLKPIEIQHENNYINSIIFGDNEIVLNILINEFAGKIDLIYIDPPFGTKQDFIDYDGVKGYSDKVTNELFLEFLRERLYLLKKLLSPKGSIYLHIDKKMGHYVKIIMDEVFGESNYINEITRIKCNPKNFTRKAYGNYSDTIFFYAKEKDKNIWNDITIPLDNNEIENAFPKIDSKGQRYTTHPLHAPGVTENGPTGEMWNGMLPPKGRHWRYNPDILTKLLEDNLIEWSSTGNPRKIVYAKDHKGKKPQDIWEYKDKGAKYTTYPTEKNRDLLKFIINNSSNEDSIVLDCFAGSFSTLIEAAKLNRKFIGIDSSESSIKTGKENMKNENIIYNYFELDEEV